MTINEWLSVGTKKLEKTGIATARLDCLVLLEDATGKDRSWLLAHPDTQFATLFKGRTLADNKLLDSQVARRANHEPLAYIRGKSEFYGREFVVSHHTLQPRSETETMITLFKKMTAPQKITDQRVRPFEVVDVGTGSGCIGITAKLELADVEVVGVDISEECLVVARQNAEKLGAEVMFYKGSLLEPVKDKTIDVLLCNLPYVPDTHTINEAAMQEPKLAIFGGADGLDLYRELFKQIEGYSLKPAHILTESLPFQHHSLATIARHYGYTLEKTDDFIQVFTGIY